MGNVVENRAVVDVVPLSRAGRRAGGGLAGLPGAGGRRVRRRRLPEPAGRRPAPELEALVPPALADRLGTAGPWRVTASLVGPGRMRVETLA